MDYENQIVSEKEDKQERWFNSSIWFVLVFVCALSFLFAVYKHIQEIDLKMNGNMYTATYMDTSQSAYFLDENGNTVSVRLSDWFPSLREKEVDLYYYGDDISQAKPLTIMEFWIITEVGFGGFTALFLWRAVKNFKPTRHYKGVV